MRLSLIESSKEQYIVNETVLTTLPYQLPDQVQELFGVARPAADKAPSAARLALYPAKAAKRAVNQQGP